MGKVKRYKCPYCEARMDREKLIPHIAHNHEEMIPQGYTPRRVVFNYVNHKDGGRCVICGKPSRWVEESGHYDRYCSEACRKKAREQYKANMLRVRGTTNILEDPEMQTKMLAGRSISGKYTFNDGGVKTYTGSYEAKLLEFADKGLNIPSEYIDTPGPILEYEYNGKIHKWVTDQYWWPWNLIIEVKDGGKNPNNRPMEDSRARQLCKEIMITDKGTYNYLRLTDNQFPQLIEILMEIKKENMDDAPNKPIIKIYESVNIPVQEASVVQINKNPKVDPNNQHGVYFDRRSPEYYDGNPYALDTNWPKDPRAKAGVFFIAYSFTSDIDDDSIEGFAVADDLIPQKLLIVKNNKVTVESGSFLDDRKLTIYRYNGDKTIRDIITTEDVGDDYFYTALTGKKLYIMEQPLLDYENFSLLDVSLYQDIKESYDATMWGEFNTITNKQFVLPVVSVTERAEAEMITNGIPNITILEDIDGYFVFNKTLQQRTKSYPSVSDIPKRILTMISSQNIRESVYYAYTDLLLFDDPNRI